MPSPLHNGESIMTAVGGGGAASSWSKVRRFGALLLLLRLAALCFCLTAAVFATTDASVLHLRPFRLLLAANAIVAVYSVFEGGAAMWEMVRGTTLLPEPLQLWFDFSHDQVFGYLAVAAGAAAARDASMCNKLVQNERNTSCLQAYIAVGLGFAGFAFLAISSLASGYRLVCFLVTGSRFPSSY